MGKITKTYNENDELHSFDDEPAIIHPDVLKLWFKNGKFHRDGDKPAIIFNDGEERFYKNGKEYTPKVHKYPPSPKESFKLGNSNCWNKDCDYYKTNQIDNCRKLVYTNACFGFYGEEH